MENTNSFSEKVIFPEDKTEIVVRNLRSTEQYSTKKKNTKSFSVIITL